eukprot:jgi/Chrzof1/10964/Cz05g18260.t1
MLMTLMFAGQQFDEFPAEVGLGALSSLTQLTSLSVINISNLSNDLMKTWAQGLQMLKTLHLICHYPEGVISDFPGTSLEQLTLCAEGDMTVSLHGLPSSIEALTLSSSLNAQLSFQDPSWVWQAERCSKLKELSLYSSGPQASGLLHAFRYSFHAMLLNYIVKSHGHVVSGWL